MISLPMRLLNEVPLIFAWKPGIGQVLPDQNKFSLLAKFLGVTRCPQDAHKEDGSGKRAFPTGIPM